METPKRLVRYLNQNFCTRLLLFIGNWDYIAIHGFAKLICREFARSQAMESMCNVADIILQSAPFLAIRTMGEARILHHTIGSGLRIVASLRP